jgi:hypothetical protein
MGNGFCKKLAGLALTALALGTESEVTPSLVEKRTGMLSNRELPRNW